METEKEYKVVELDNFGGTLQISSRKFRSPQKGEVIIKVICTTIHQADLFYIQGLYGSKQPKIMPTVPGIEGSGEIVYLGEDVDSYYQGKKCCFTANSNHEGVFEGAWAQYFYAEARNILVFGNEIDYEKICFSFINPLTAVGFLDTIEKTNQKAVAQNAANSTVGKMFIKFCKIRGIKTLNLVRKEDQIESLKTLGADYVISTSNENWQKDFQEIANGFNIQYCFEAVGSEITGTIMSLLPPCSTIIHYGNLEEGKPCSNINSRDLIFYKKKLEGWWLSNWIEEVGQELFTQWVYFVITEISKGSDIFETKISKRFKLEEINIAKEFYFGGNMSLGKVIINPNN